MTTRSGPDAADSGRGRPDTDLDAVMGERRQLINLTYRLLGSLAEAEDAVQETYARWYAMSARQQDAIECAAAWLTTVASRICLILLRSARAGRETYVGDVFRYPFAEVAEITSRTPAACRQLASSARRRIREAQAPATPPAHQAGIIRAFKQAWKGQRAAAYPDFPTGPASAPADFRGLGDRSGCRRTLRSSSSRPTWLAPECPPLAARSRSFWHVCGTATPVSRGS
jgi:DNA-directed RNA polymerase specialized sigma24 family protein